MTFARRVLATAAFCAATWTTSAPAHACSGPLPGAHRTAVFPGDGATGVPISARVWLFYTGLSAPTDPWIRRADGTLIDVDVEARPAPGIDAQVLIVRPRVPLAPMTPYEIWDRVAADDTIMDAHAYIATFTTGVDADLTPPVLSGETRLAIGARDTCDSSACCGPYDAIRFTLDWDRASDERGDVVLYEVGGTITSAISASGAYLCSGGFDIRGPPVDFIGSARQQVRALDLSENGSVPNPPPDRDVVEMCTPLDAGPSTATPDAGPDEADDGGRSGEDSGVGAADSPGDGCGCSVPRRNGGWTLHWLALVGVLLLLARTRRRQGALRVSVPRRRDAARV